MQPDLDSRIRRAQKSLADHGVDGLIVSPGPDLRYLSGYAATALERLTALVLPADADPLLVVPELEEAEASRSPAGAAGIAIRTHAETDDAHRLAVSALGSARQIAVDDHMWAARLFALQAAADGASFRAAGAVLAELRMRKAPDEVAALREAAQAIDRVHDRMDELLVIGATEQQAAAAISEAITAAGHEQVDFVIVGSGPNGASPHHAASERTLQAGDVVVIDIGGTTPAGYCSDSTRTYVLGGEPPPAVTAFYDVLQRAQAAQCEHARPGVTAESVDAVGRGIIADAGFGENFFHRTGHGIGLETHEEPYIVTGSDRVLEPGMAFSIEPGIYLPGRYGARIEDIVVTTDNGLERLNLTSRELRVLAG